LSTGMAWKKNNSLYEIIRYSGLNQYYRTLLAQNL
jgi:hypothetical protein